MLRLSGVILLNSAVGDIDARISDGAAHVVLEPGTPLLLSTGLAALVSRRHRQRRSVS